MRREGAAARSTQAGLFHMRREGAAGSHNTEKGSFAADEAHQVTW
jgi:hypothetical protein